MKEGVKKSISLILVLTLLVQLLPVVAFGTGGEAAEREGYTAPVTLASYTYEGNVNNGRLATMTYGNGDSVSYTYDAFDRQRTAAYNDGTTYHYDYSGDNDLTRQYVTDGKLLFGYQYTYDTAGNIRSIFMYIGGQCGRFFLNPAKMT